MAKYTNENVFKVLVVGDGFTGKTSLIDRYTSGQFSDHFTATPMFKNGFKAVEIKGSNISLYLREVAGNFNSSLHDDLYAATDGLAIVYDVTNGATISRVPEITEKINTYTKDPIVAKILIGNKTDLEEKRSIDYKEAQELAESLGMSYIETSAKNDTNITEAFDTLTKKILESKATSLESNSQNSQSSCILL